jgi:hypothetical protein
VSLSEYDQMLYEDESVVSICFLVYFLGQRRVGSPSGRWVWERRAQRTLARAALGLLSEQDLGGEYDLAVAGERVG